MSRLGVVAAITLVAAPAAAEPAPSPVVYPPVERRALRFSHASHASQPCAACHGAVRHSVSARDRNLPRESACAPCHGKNTRARLEERSGPAKRCGTCHVGFDGQGPPRRVAYPTANLRFGHRIHLERGVGCGGCHVFGTKDAKARPLPRMSTCTSCHRRRRVDVRCATCHLSNKDGRLQTRFAAGLLRPSGVVAGDAHTREFARGHAAVARANRRHCESCHAPASCLKCHAGSLRPMRIHAGDYATRHALDARRNQPRCDRCHRTQTFCLGCHQRMGVGQETGGGGFRPSTGRRFHPPGFVSIQRGPGHHGYAARRNVRTCSSCHREATCVRCHGTRAAGRGGFSPHPPGFRSSHKCRSLAARNQRVCLKCHGQADDRIRCN